MATFKIGAIITQISGSIGGTTFRKSANSNIIYNKQKRQNLSRNNNNSKSFINGFYFKAWGNLQEDERQGWNDIAPLYQFEDKFGDPKTLTGRQFFTKMQCQLNRPLEITRSKDIDPLPPVFVFSDIILDYGGEIFLIVGQESNEDNFIVVKAKRVSKGTASAGNVSGLTFYQDFGGDLNEWNVFFAFRDAFPLTELGDRFIIEICSMNVAGFQSAYTRKVITIE